MKTLLLEIGTEELPLSIFPEILDQMEILFSKYLQQANLAWDKIKIMATPRRLTVMVTGLPEKQTGKEIEVIGPPYKIAFDHDGNPTKAAIGFAQKQGVSVSELTCIETPKGEYVGVKIKESDQPTEEILAKLLPNYILSLSFPKYMRWHEGKIRFSRPIHWILALLDNKIIPFTIDGIKSNNITFGHRFFAPEAITIFHPDQYISKLKRAFVIVEPEKRENEIINLANKAAQKIGGRPLLDQALLNWVNFLVEYPVAIAGKFDDAFLELPSPVLITVMKHHQKYLPIQNEKQRLLPGFVAIINTPVDNTKPVQRGLERVLQARLADARFFYEKDLKTPLIDYLPQLKGVIFQADLGSVWEKVQRIEKIAGWLAEKIAPEKKEAVIRAALLCKTDLITEMVNEFPELQGVMGGIYAQKQGEPEAVVKAIGEHYLPIEAGGLLPQTEEGAILSIADKIDTLVGCFGLGLIPTGTTDPFALRRKALGILRILHEKAFSLSLFELIDLGIKGYKGRFASEIKGQLIEFFKNRLASLLMEKGHSHAVMESIVAVFDGYVPSTFAKADALSEFSQSSHFQPLVIAYKRVYRIIQTTVSTMPNPSLFKEPQERALFEKYLEIKKKINTLLGKKDYYGALNTLVTLKSFIDDFFDHVMVMVEDKELRQNRLALLTQIKELFLQLADLSKIPI